MFHHMFSQSKIVRSMVRQGNWVDLVAHLFVRLVQHNSKRRQVALSGLNGTPNSQIHVLLLG